MPGLRGARRGPGHRLRQEPRVTPPPSAPHGRRRRCGRVRRVVGRRGSRVQEPREDLLSGAVLPPRGLSA